MTDKNPSPQETNTDIKTQNPDLQKDLQAPKDEKGGFRDAGLLEPTRNGDWDVKGRCSDF